LKEDLISAQDLGHGSSSVIRHFNQFSKPIRFEDIESSRITPALIEQFFKYLKDRVNMDSELTIRNYEQQFFSELRKKFPSLIFPKVENETSLPSRNAVSKKTKKNKQKKETEIADGATTGEKTPGQLLFSADNNSSKSTSSFSFSFEPPDSCNNDIILLPAATATATTVPNFYRPLFDSPTSNVEQNKYSSPPSSPICIEFPADFMEKTTLSRKKMDSTFQCTRRFFSIYYR
jgi:hypothetical protein